MKTIEPVDLLVYLNGANLKISNEVLRFYGTDNIRYILDKLYKQINDDILHFEQEYTNINDLLRAWQITQEIDGYKPFSRGRYNMLSFEINNGGKLVLLQLEHDSEVIIYTSNSDLTNVSNSDMVMLINYYKHIKNNNIQCDFINFNGTEKG